MSLNGWNNSSFYNDFMGRWSMRVAQLFLSWLNENHSLQNKKWIDVGCGTGALTFEILKQTNPESVLGVDSSPEYLPKSSSTTTLSFRRGSSSDLPVKSEQFDYAVSALALNFMPNHDQCIKEMMRVLKKNGILSLYVWDYKEQMEFLRYFWDSAIEAIPRSKDFDEGEKFPICRREALKELFEKNTLTNIEMKDLIIQTEFRNFEDYWIPFLRGQGPSGEFLTSLNEKERNLIKNKLLEKLPYSEDGTITLKARSFAIKGVKSC